MAPGNGADIQPPQESCTYIRRGRRFRERGTVVPMAKAVKGDQPEQQDHDLTVEEREVLVAAGIEAAYEDAGYVPADDEVDTDNQRSAWINHALASAIYSHDVKKAFVRALEERSRKAVRKGVITGNAFPSVAKPDEWSNEPDYEVARRIWQALERKCWDLCKADHSGAVQKMCSELGVVLVRCKVTEDQIDAVYVTDDVECILTDFDSPHTRKLVKAAESFGKNLSMVMGRLPEATDDLHRDYKRTMRQALTTGKTMIAPALEAASDSGNTDDDNDE